jgi:hypothetical protein
MLLNLKVRIRHNKNTLLGPYSEPVESNTHLHKLFHVIIFLYCCEIERS